MRGGGGKRKTTDKSHVALKKKQNLTASCVTAFNLELRRENLFSFTTVEFTWRNCIIIR